MSRVVLGVDTAFRSGSVALALDGATIVPRALPSGGHSSALSAVAESLLAGRGLSFRELSGLAVAQGPGSFTGLRVGLAWAKGVATVLSLPLALVSSHEALAAAARAASPALATLLPGERGFVQAAFWEGGEEARLLFGPISVPEGELPGLILEREEGRAGERPAILAPDLPEALSVSLRAAGFAILPAPPAAGEVARLGDLAIREGRTVDLATAAPAYGRAPNARKPAR